MLASKIMTISFLLIVCVAVVVWALSPDPRSRKKGGEED